MQDSLIRVNSLSDARESHAPDTVSSAGASHVPSQPLSVPSPRGKPSRDFRLPLDTRNTVGTLGNVFERLPAREAPYSALSENSQNLAPSSCGFGPGRKYEGKWKRDETRAAKFVNINQPWTHPVILEELVLTMIWWITRDFRSRKCILENSQTLWNFMLESQRQDCSMFENSISSSHNALDRRSLDSNVNWRAHDIAIDCGANRYPRLRYAWCEDCVCIEEASHYACALPKKSMCRRAACSKDDQFLRGRQIVYMIYAHFRATGAYEAVQGLLDLFNIRLQNDDVQDFDTRWDQALLSGSDIHTDMVLEGLYKSKLQDSVQLQTVLALYDQETVRNNEPPNYSRLKTTVRRHIDQTVRTRNFRARNEIVERGAVTKSQKGKESQRGVESGRVLSVESNWTMFRKETHVVSVMIQLRDTKDNRLLRHQMQTHRLTERHPQKVQAAGERALLEQEARFRAEISWEESVRTRHVLIGTLPCVSITSLNQDAHMATNVISDTLRQKESPTESRRNVVWKDQLPF